MIYWDYESVPDRVATLLTKLFVEALGEVIQDRKFFGWMLFHTAFERAKARFAYEILKIAGLANPRKLARAPKYLLNRPPTAAAKPPQGPSLASSSGSRPALGTGPVAAAVVSERGSILRSLVGARIEEFVLATGLSERKAKVSLLGLPSQSAWEFESARLCQDLRYWKPNYMGESEMRMGICPLCMSLLSSLLLIPSLLWPRSPSQWHLMAAKVGSS